MQKSSFFNAELIDGKHDRAYLAEDFARYFSSFIGNGIFPSPSTNLQVLALNENMSVTVKAGKAWINGYFYENTDGYILNIDNADGVLNRIDRIVVQLSHINREITLKILKGTPAATPVVPPLTRNADIYELCIAEVTVDKGIIKISQAAITDTRLNTNVCGIVKGTVDVIDTTTLFTQYNDWFSSMTQSSQQSFLSWFDNIKGILNSETAGNLLNLINNHKAENNAHFTDGEKAALLGRFDSSGKALKAVQADNAAHAVNADKALEADKAATADSSTNAQNLGGSPRTDWVATSVGVADGVAHVNLTVPNFVFTEGCRVSFMIPTNLTVPTVLYHLRINSGEWFDLISQTRERGVSQDLIKNIYVTVYLSSEIIFDGYKSAFFKSGGAEPKPLIYVQTSAPSNPKNGDYFVEATGYNLDAIWSDTIDPTGVYTPSTCLFLHLIGGAPRRLYLHPAHKYFNLVSGVDYGRAYVNGVPQNSRVFYYWDGWIDISASRNRLFSFKYTPKTIAEFDQNTLTVIREVATPASNKNVLELAGTTTELFATFSDVNYNTYFAQLDINTLVITRTVYVSTSSAIGGMGDRLYTVWGNRGLAELDKNTFVIINSRDLISSVDDLSGVGGTLTKLVAYSNVRNPYYYDIDPNSLTVIRRVTGNAGYAGSIEGTRDKLYTTAGNYLVEIDVNTYLNIRANPEQVFRGVGGVK